MENEIRVALYARVSTNEQRLHGYSIKAQLSELRKYANDHHYHIVKEYVDEGFSGGTTKRPALTNLLEDIAQDKIELIIFVKLDRWFRSVKDYYKIQEILDEHNVKWLTTQEDYETLTSSGQFKVNIMLSVSEQFKTATSERINSVFNYKIENGYYISAYAPVGFEIEKTKNGNIIMIDEEVREAFTKALELAKEGYYVKDIIKILKNDYNIDVTLKNMQTFFHSPLVHGEYHEIPHFLEGYITKKEHQTILKIMEKNASRGNTKKRTYIFKGLIHCPNCGRKLIGTTQNQHSKGKLYKYTIYHCGGTRNEIKRCMYTTSLRESNIEKQILPVLKAEMERQLKKHANNHYLKWYYSNIFANNKLNDNYFSLSQIEKQEIFKEVIKEITINENNDFVISLNSKLLK